MKLKKSQRPKKRYLYFRSFDYFNFKKSYRFYYGNLFWNLDCSKFRFYEKNNCLQIEVTKLPQVLLIIYLFKLNKPFIIKHKHESN